MGKHHPKASKFEKGYAAALEDVSRRLNHIAPETHGVMRDPFLPYHPVVQIVRELRNHPSPRK